MRDAINLYPYPCLVTDMRGDFVDCNDHMMEYIGIADRGNVTKNFISMLDEIIPPYQPDGMKSLSLAERLERLVRYNEDCFETWVNIRGQLSQLEVSLKQTELGGMPVIVVFILDLHRLPAVRDLSKYNSAMLRAVERSSKLLIGAGPESAEIHIPEALGILAYAVGAHRASIFKYNDDQPDAADIIYWYSRSSQETLESVGYKGTINDARDIPHWAKIIRSGNPINNCLSDVPAPEIDILKRLGSRSILITPVKVRGKIWGAIFFEDNLRERVFTSDEITIMSTGATLLVSCCCRIELMRNLIDTSQAKSRFLANMSHEIRTPMNAIIGMANVARASGDSEKIIDCLGKIDGASQLLLNIINDILDMSKIESGKFELLNRVFEFRPAVDNVISIFAGRFAEKDLTLDASIDPDVPEFVEGDDTRLSQIINNLFSNAIKFTPGGGSIKLTACVKEHSPYDSLIEMRVSDTGIGIPPDRLEDVFNAFDQIDPSITRRYGGTGLGLPISRSFAQAMGGDIRVESTLNEGSTFILTLLFKHAERAEKSENPTFTAPESYNFNGKVFLLAEDIDINREVVVSLLEPTGALVECAEDGARCLQMIENDYRRYACVLMDVQMPVMDGLEATRKIRAFETENGLGSVHKIGHVPVIAMTANAYDEDRQVCQDAGMDEHASKPIELDVLLAKIAMCVQ